MKSIILVVLFLFTGCDNSGQNTLNVKTAHVKNYNNYDLDVICDKRGYAYYTFRESLTPVLSSHSGHLQQLRCEDLK